MLYFYSLWKHQKKVIRHYSLFTNTFQQISWLVSIWYEPLQKVNYEQIIMPVRKYLPIKTRTIKKPVTWFAFQINWLVSPWYESLPKGISEQTLQSVQNYFSVKTVRNQPIDPKCKSIDWYLYDANPFWKVFPNVHIPVST